MSKIPFRLFLGACIILVAVVLNAEHSKNKGTKKEIKNTPTKLYPFNYTLKMKSEVACTVALCGEPYYAITDWMVGDEIYKSYQDPTVISSGCTYPFQVEAVALGLQFAEAGTVWASVDIEDLDATQSEPDCPYPGYAQAVSPEWGFYIPEAGIYLAVLPFDEPVEVSEPYFCGFYIANDVSNMIPGLVTDNDPFLCANWNDWGEGFVDLTNNDYYNFPGNLIMFSIGHSGSSGPQLIKSDICWPLDSAQVSKNVSIRVAETVDTLSFSFCRFEYRKTSAWTKIAEDSNSQICLRSGVSPATFNEGYATAWNATGLAEGWYVLKSTIFSGDQVRSMDTINVYLDNTPLEPVIAYPTYRDTICDTITLTANVSDEDVNFIQFEYRPASDTIRKTLPALLQARYGDTDNDTLDGNNYSSGEFGDFYNAPTAMASVIRHFGNQGYTSVVKDGSLNLTDRKIVEQLADSMRIRRNHGAQDDNLLLTVEDYFKNKGNLFTIKLTTTLTPQLLDYYMGYKLGAVVLAISQPYGFWLPITELDFPPNVDGTYSAKVYDTKTGINQATTLQFSPTPQILYAGSYRPIDLCLGIYPKADTSRITVIGSDINPANGISYFWNLSSLADGKYYLSASGMDFAFHSGEGVTRVYRKCLSGYLHSDVNGDGYVNVSDAVWLINFVFAGGPAPLPVRENGDSNCDGYVNVSDAVWIINYVFAGGPRPCN